MLTYSPTAYYRAYRAWHLSPFHLALFQVLQERGVPLGKIQGSQGFQAGYTVRPLAERQAEDELMWLIQVGVLRREVDGQGITDSYRLAPLGRQILESVSSASQDQKRGSFQDWITDRLTRWGLT
ncbi:MAG: Npun_F0494 family protein [Cyanophyceae cyanobacterium]